MTQPHPTRPHPAHPCKRSMIFFDHSLGRQRMCLKAVSLGLVMIGAAVGLVGCCSGACRRASAVATESAPVVKVVADPPCTAEVELVDAGVQITVNPLMPHASGNLSCQVYEWLSDGSELTAQAS